MRTPPNIPPLKRDSTAVALSLLEFICKGDTTRALQVLDRTTVRSVHPLTGGTPLHLAVIFNQPLILDAILAVSTAANVNTRDGLGRTALHYAAVSDDPEVFYRLVAVGAKVNVTDHEGFDAEDFRLNSSLIDLDAARTNNQFPMNENFSFLHAEDELNFTKQVTGPHPFPSHADTVEILNGQLLTRLPLHSEDVQTADIRSHLIDLQTRVHGMWEALREGDDRTVKQLICDKRLALSKDSLTGMTPLHVAYLLNRESIISYLQYVCPEASAVRDKKGRVPSEMVGAAEERRHFLTRRLAGSHSQEGVTRTAPEGEGSVVSSSLMHTNGVSSNGTQMRDMEEEVTERLHSIDILDRDYTVLEELQIEGKAEEMLRVVKRNVGNERLLRYVAAFRDVQSRLLKAFHCVERGDREELVRVVDEDVVRARDARGMRLLTVAVLKERHELCELIASSFPSLIDLTDSYGRSALHYAAVQGNAIYDSLVDLGASATLKDKDGYSAECYREKPSLMVRSLSSITSSPLINHTVSTEDEVFDPDAPSDEDIDEWVALGEVEKLEQLMLDGRGHLLRDKSTVNVASQEFLRGLTQYQSKIDAIHKAVEDGDVRRVKSLMDRTVFATARDSYGLTPLHKALLHGQTNTVRYLLLKYPQCVNAADHAGRTALHYAAADPNGEHMIKVLQKAGGDAFIEDKHGHTPFYYRTHGQRLNVRMMKDNAVMSQLISGQLNRILLQDLEEDIYDWIHTGNIGKLEELVLTGYADLLLGRTHEVEDADSIGFLEVLPQYQAKIQAIHKAVETGNLRAVKLLTDRKKLALCRDSRGLSPLHKAIVFERTDIAKYLIRNYPQSVNAMDQKKRTPLHYAAALRDSGYLYKVMRKCGADPNIYDCNGRHAKHYLKHAGEIDLGAMRMDTKAALKQVLHNRVAPSYLESSIQQWIRDGHVQKLEQLVLSGCGDLLQNRTSNQPEMHTFLSTIPSVMSKIDAIHRAIREGDLLTVKDTMTSKKLAIARDRHGCTPLHAAVVHEQTEILRYIASNFPSVLNAPDYNKRTAMHYAAAARDGGHYLKILGKGGADPMAVDNEGRTPDYYRRNAVLDLKMIKEREDDYETMQMISEELMNENGADTPGTPDSASISSGVDSARREDEEEETETRVRFEQLVYSRVSLPTSENGIYLARTVAPVLTKALAEVLLRRPADPIAFISDWLHKYHSEVPNNHH